MESFKQRPLFQDLEQASVQDRDFHTTLRRSGVWLSQDEAAFLDAAFGLILPERRHGDCQSRVNAAEYVEEQIVAQTECIISEGKGPSAQDVSLSPAQIAEVYRFGVAAVQRHCIASYETRFQDLPVLHQHLVLGQLEQGCSGAELDRYASLFQLLLHHASEAYFEVTQVALRRRRSALVASFTSAR